MWSKMERNWNWKTVFQMSLGGKFGTLVWCCFLPIDQKQQQNAYSSMNEHYSHSVWSTGKCMFSIWLFGVCQCQFLMWWCDAVNYLSQLLFATHYVQCLWVDRNMAFLKQHHIPILPLVVSRVGKWFGLNHGLNQLKLNAFVPLAGINSILPGLNRFKPVKTTGWHKSI